VWGGLQLAWWALSWWGLRRESDAPYFLRFWRNHAEWLHICVVIPARDESAVIAETVGQWIRQPGVSEVVVVDDDSRDKTAELAAFAGAEVFHSPGLGKAEGLRRFVAATRENQSEYVYLFVDADNRPGTADCALRIAARAVEDVCPVQCELRGAGGSLLQDSLAVERSCAWAVLESGRCRFGGSAFLGATGWACTAEVLHWMDFPVYSTCDDLALSVQLAGEGVAVHYVEDTFIYEDEPATWRVLWRQRVRWGRGTLQVLFDHDMVAAMRGREWGMGWFIAGGQFAMVYIVLAMMVSAVVAPQGLVRGLLSMVLMSVPFATAGALRTRRWRGIMGYMVIWAVNVGAFVVALTSWRNMAWIPTVHKGYGNG
jgi:cellulose synthase/poly-beta-1,6-N-acetylglucosamine synthase-like glycosyltransferase